MTGILSLTLTEKKEKIDFVWWFQKQPCNKNERLKTAINFLPLFPFLHFYSTIKFKVYKLPQKCVKDIFSEIVFLYDCDIKIQIR